MKKLEETDYTSDQKVAELRRALTVYIRINLGTNPVYETLSQRLERLIKSRDENQKLQGMKGIVKEINEVDKMMAEKGISKEEHALLTITQKINLLQMRRDS